MAATRLIPMHVIKGKTPLSSVRERTDYAMNPEKTEGGELVSSYGCEAETVNEEFMLERRNYCLITGRDREKEVAAYQIRQSFKPDEITPEEANRVGMETALRFTKGNHAFIVATHTDRAHIHNHIIFNSVSMDGKKKFRNFFLSAFALQRVSDMVCLEHGLSVIEKGASGGKSKRRYHCHETTKRELLEEAIGRSLAKKPKDLDAFLKLMEGEGYEHKSGKYLSFRGRSGKTFIRLCSLHEGFRDEDIANAIAGKPSHRKEERLSLLMDVEEKLRTKGSGYARFAKTHNLKQLSKTLLYLRDHGIESMEELEKLTDEASARKDALLEELNASEARLKMIGELRKHIVNYSKTRKVYEDYRLAGYSKKFLAEHSDEIALHKTAKKAFDELSLKKIPRVKDLSAEYEEVLSGKRSAYKAFKETRDETRELLIVRENIRALYAAETEEKDHKPRKGAER